MHPLLPPEVTYSKYVMDGFTVYTFRHRDIGELGRLVASDEGETQTRINCEVVGDPDDPMTQSRLVVFQPLTEKILHAMTSAQPGVNTVETLIPDALVPTPSPYYEQVESKMLPCESCGQPVVLLIFAAQANCQGEFEDYARKMFPQYREINVPTWIIGEPQGVPGWNTPSNIMKVWPVREPIQPMTPTDFNVMLDMLMAQHCSH